MSDESKPTPTPWRTIKDLDPVSEGDTTHFIESAINEDDDSQFAGVGIIHNHADAALIVEAVNAHADLTRQRDALLAACRGLMSKDGLEQWQARKLARAAIADCEKETPNA